MTPEEEPEVKYIELTELTEEEGEAAEAKHSLLVGEVARASALAEYRVRQLMLGLLGSKYAEYVVGGLGMAELIETSRVLVKENEEITDDQRAEIDGFLGALSALLPLRNNLVHGVWVPFGSWHAGQTPPDPYALVNKRRSALKAVAISYESAEQLAADFSRVGSGISTWAVSVLGAEARKRREAR